MAAKTDSQDTRNLAAYGQIIIHLARKHGGMGWRQYDNQFRQQVAAGASLSWANLNPSLMAATVLGASGDGTGRVCSLCLATDHIRSDCALNMDSAKSVRSHTQVVSHANSQRFRPYYRGQADNICYRFNRGTCNQNPCKYSHMCTACSKPGHGAFECQKFRRQPGNDPKPPPGRS